MLHLEGRKTISFFLTSSLWLIDRRRYSKVSGILNYWEKTRLRVSEDEERKGFVDICRLSYVQQQHPFFLFAMIYFAHKTTFETITCHGFIWFFLMLYRSLMSEYVGVCIYPWVLLLAFWRFCFRQNEQFTHITRETN